ncbi:MAG: dihydrolipoamide acetyltransferase family protein [Alicyclobacillaceae bacterium]|nr:dihydrolipoamide acetyltransferase family protein [Alicyclobacillaceae bacterium]
MAEYVFRLPDIGEGIHEGEIVRWLVQAGDVVEEDQPLCEVQNDKAVVEIPSPVKGTVREIKVPAGKIAVVGDPLIVFDVAESSSGGGAAAGAPGRRDGAVAGPGGETSKAEVNAVAGEAPPRKAEPANGGEASGRPGSVLATPGVRRFAREKGVDLTKVTGTGRNGRITRQDVLRYLEAGASMPEGPSVPVAGPEGPRGADLEERVPLAGIRRAIAQAMVKSVYTAPHVTVMDEANVSKLVALRERAKGLAEQKGVKLTYLPFVVKAAVAGLRQYPELNASIDDEKDEIVFKKYYNIGIATDTERGLLVPVVKEADRKNIWTLAAEIRDLAERARTGKLAPHEMKGGTFSITNIGAAGGLFFTPVINYPEVAILGIGRITEKPVARDGQVVIAPVMALSLSFDHRLIDGATAQRYVNYVKQLLEDPELLTLEV